MLKDWIQFGIMAAGVYALAFFFFLYGFGMIYRTNRLIYWLVVLSFFIQGGFDLFRQYGRIEQRRNDGLHQYPSDDCHYDSHNDFRHFVFHVPFSSLSFRTSQSRGAGHLFQLFQLGVCL